MRKWTRRAFITVGTLVGGGLILGVAGVAFAPNRFGIRDSSGKDGASLTTWVKITPDNKVIALIPHCEMGQGAITGVAMLLAEELQANWQDVEVQEAPAESIYANGHFMAGMLQNAVGVPSWLERALEYSAYRISRFVPLMITGGSSSTTTTGQYGMRVAGAAAKTMLRDAAAAQWGVPVEECHAANTHIHHAGSGRKASFGELAQAASKLKPPVHPVLKDRKDFTIVGKSKPRGDIPSKVDGTAQFAVDVSLPGMLYATVRATPIPGGVLESVDPAPALAIEGVVRVIELEDAVAVVAKGYWSAQQGVRALQPVFSDAGLAAVNSDSLFAAHAQSLDSGDGDVNLKVGDGAEGLAHASQVITAEYRLPYLAHASMEPMAATAVVENGRCEMWSGTQDPLNARNVAAKAIDIDEDAVLFHNMQLGGSYGRRLPFAFDYIDQAARIANAVSPTPVKMIWSREEDMSHDFYRPDMLARFKGGLDEDGNACCWVSAFTGSGGFGDAHPPYEIEHQEVLVFNAPKHLRTGSWRSVGHSQQGFIVESFIDEMAVAAGKDTYQYRRELLKNKPRQLAVLDRAAEMAGWNQPRQEGRGLGIALVESFGTTVCEVAEVSVGASGKPRVHHVWAAVDCGQVVNPDQALAQIQGGIIFGLSAALYQEITLEKGAVKQRSFPDFNSVKLADAPRVTVEFLETDSPMGGLGEPGVPPIAAAVANAIYAVSGERKRSLPLIKAG
jgi:isoquinoline 1-oxidoreductase beta subunit